MVKNKTVDDFQIQRETILMKYECVKVEHYQRIYNLRVYGMEED